VSPSPPAAHITYLCMESTTAEYLKNIPELLGLPKTAKRLRPSIDFLFILSYTRRSHHVSKMKFIPNKADATST
jgi:hypothetical protein